MAILASIVIALISHLLIMHSSFGVLLRGVGGNSRSVERAGWSIVLARGVTYGLAAFYAVLSGIALVGLTTSADANIALRYTLLSIAGVILGGGEFVGGKVSPVGAVIGALTLTLAGAFLSFLHISPDWQIGAQGFILIIVLALRLLLNRIEKARSDHDPMDKHNPQTLDLVISGNSNRLDHHCDVHRRRQFHQPVSGSAHIRGLFCHSRHWPDVCDYTRTRKHRSLCARDDDTGRHSFAQIHGC